MSLDEFWQTYGPEGENLYPTWEDSGYSGMYSNVLEQLGMLNTTIRLAGEELDLDLDQLGLRKEATMETAITQKEGIGMQMESQFLASGGVTSGRRAEAAKDVSQNITQALGLEFRGMDIEKDLLLNVYEGELVSIEGSKINYENELISLENQYGDHLNNLINMLELPDDPDEDDEEIIDPMNAFDEPIIEQEDQPPGNEGIADEASCTEICIPYANQEMGGGMTCYDSCLGTPTIGAGQFTPDDFQWINLMEEEAACDGAVEWNPTTETYDCNNVNASSCGYGTTWNNGCCRHQYGSNAGQCV